MAGQEIPKKEEILAIIDKHIQNRKELINWKLVKHVNRYLIFIVIALVAVAIILVCLNIIPAAIFTFLGGALTTAVNFIQKTSTDSYSREIVKLQDMRATTKTLSSESPDLIKIKDKLLEFEL